MKKLRKVGRIAIPAVSIVAAGVGAVKTYGDYSQKDSSLMLLNAEELSAYAEGLDNGASGSGYCYKKVYETNCYEYTIKMKSKKKGILSSNFSPESFTAFVCEKQWGTMSSSGCVGEGSFRCSRMNTSEHKYSEYIYVDIPVEVIE